MSKMKMKQWKNSSVFALAAAVGTFVFAGCVSGGNQLDKSDLSPLANVGKASGESVRLIVDGKLTMPIVIGKKATQRSSWAADFLAESIEDMTGSKPVIVKDDKKINGPAIYIGNLEALKDAGLSSEKMVPGEFAVKTKNGSVYLYGNDTGRSSGSAYAVFDFSERVLEVREYFDPQKGGRSVVKTQNLTIDPLDYGDRPVFEKRDLWPYYRKDMQTWRIADTHPIQLIVHAPHDWGKDQDYRKNRPEIFQLEKDGTRTSSPMLCYGNPKTLETYLERIDEELKGGRKSGVLNGKAVTVSPWDMGVGCHCADCCKLFDEKAGDSGSASKIMCSFVRKLSDELAKKHPELTIIYLPYLNYCDIPEGTSFPAGNVEVQLCTMPGLAMLKEPSVKAHEEKLIKDWAKVTGGKIQNWHYICWPAEFTSAPYIYADTIIQHYKDTRNYTVGSFINGGYDEPRLLLSAYVWMRALWNPELNSQAIFDEFAKRMFGPAEKPMRRLIQLQDEGWKRHWEVAKVSPKNIFEVSYPRKDVVEMEKCFDEAYALAGNDALIKKRLDHYKKGFEQFFKESKENAEGTAFAPLQIQKAASNPVIDGKLDETEWKRAEVLNFIRATDKKTPKPTYPTTVQAVWTPDGVTFGFRMTEPTPDKLWISEPAGSWHNDNVELFFDVTGKGAGDYYQIILDARNEGLCTIHAAEKDGWKPKNLKSQIYKGKDFWSAEIFIPFSEFATLKDAQIPKTSSGGLFWLGNFTRHRKADGYCKNKTEGSIPEMQRLNTRYSGWSADQSAFGTLKFVE